MSLMCEDETKERQWEENKQQAKSTKINEIMLLTYSDQVEIRNTVSVHESGRLLSCILWI